MRTADDRIEQRRFLGCRQRSSFSARIVGTQAGTGIASDGVQYWRGCFLRCLWLWSVRARTADDRVKQRGFCRRRSRLRARIFGSQAGPGIASDGIQYWRGCFLEVPLALERKDEDCR